MMMPNHALQRTQRERRGCGLTNLWSQPPAAVMSMFLIL